MKHRTPLQRRGWISPSAKWAPGSQLLSIADKLSALPTDSDQISSLLPVPLLLTLGSCLEATLNDFLIIDTHQKHGSSHYRNIVEGYIRIPFSNKLRAVVTILTDNVFQLREESDTVALLDELIVLRNRLAHTKAMMLEITPEVTQKPPAPPGLVGHPLSSISLTHCRDFLRAIHELDEKFFSQYETGYVVENDLVREIPLLPEPSDAD